MEINATHRWCSRESCCATIVGTLRWWRRGCTQRGNIPAEAGKYSKQQPKSYDGSMIVGKEFGGRLTQPTPGAAGTNAAPPSSERSDDDS